MGLKQDAIRRDPPNEIDCEDFLELHAEYVDGFLAHEQTRDLDAHARSCTSCGRYDRVVRRGLLLVRNQGEIEPSDDFNDRLMERLRQPEPQPGPLNSNVAFLVAAVLLIVCVIPLLRFSGLWLPEDEAAVATESESAQPPAGDVWWRSTGIVPAGAEAFGPFGIVAVPPDGSYSPLLIQAPLIEPAPSAPRLVTYPIPLDLSR